MTQPNKIYAVGPGQDMTSLHEVPWGALMPGDTVRVYWREQPYYEKVCISRRGRADAPITLSGVPGPNGELPVISSRNAMAALDFGNQERSCIKVGSGRFEGSIAWDSDDMPEHIIIENLDLCDAHRDFGLTLASGEKAMHVGCASAIYVECGRHITVRGNIMRDCCNGFFCAHRSRDILVQGNRIYNNGNINSFLEHNNYTSAIGITFEYNYFGPTCQGSIGNNLKDRSAGCVIRYNLIYGGNRALDLVECGDFVDEPSYRQTHVYGNVLVDIGQASNPALVHYSGDNGKTEQYRKGTLYFYHNTVISLRDDNHHVFQMDTNDERVEAYNNIFYMKGEDTALLNRAVGNVHLTGNWMTAGTRTAQEHDPEPGYTCELSQILYGSCPGLADIESGDYDLAAASPCIGAAVSLPTELSATHPVLFQYVAPNRVIRRLSTQDIGAFEV